MDDRQVIDLHWARAETAISETEKKYGRCCYSIAYRILQDNEDSEECVNDTYMKAWDSMPPHRPSARKGFLGRITRDLPSDRYARRTAEKRGFGEVPLALEELQECIPARNTTERMVEDMVLAEMRACEAGGG